MKKLGKAILFTAFIAAAVVLFLFVAGEESEGMTISLTLFYTIKIAAAASLLGLVLLYRYCCKRGWLPKEGDIWE